MKRHVVFIGLTILVFSVIMLSGCNEENKNNNNNNGDVSSFVGSWKMVTENDDIWTFYNGSTGKRVQTVNGELYTESFNWQIDNNQLCISFGTPDNVRCGSYAFSNEYNTLTWNVLRGEETLVTIFNRNI